MIKKSEELKLGEAYLPQHISRRLKHLSLGMSKASRSLSTNYQVLSNDAIFLLLRTSILFLGASVCFCLFSFFCCYTCWILAFLCGRETRSTFFIFEYSCSSLIPVEYSCLAAIFAVSSKFLYVSCVELSVFF